MGEITVHAHVLLHLWKNLISENWGKLECLILFFSRVQLRLKLIGAFIFSVKAPAMHQVRHVISPINDNFSLFATVTGKMEACMMKPEAKKKAPPVRTFTVKTKAMN